MKANRRISKSGLGSWELVKEGFLEVTLMCHLEEQEPSCGCGAKTEGTASAKQNGSFFRMATSSVWIRINTWELRLTVGPVTGKFELYHLQGLGKLRHLHCFWKSSGKQGCRYTNGKLPAPLPSSEISFGGLHFM